MAMKRKRFVEKSRSQHCGLEGVSGDEHLTKAMADAGAEGRVVATRKGRCLHIRVYERRDVEVPAKGDGEKP